MKSNDKQYDVILNIENEYDSFLEFYTDNKKNIFLNFIELFKQMNNIHNKNLFSLCINWKINDLVMSTDFTYDKTCIYMLNDIILPFFEDLEEYETCSDILNLYNQLKNS